MEMDQRGGCCIARYAGGAYDISKLDRIMLRFRPIAPKPASRNGSGSGGGSSCSASPENSGPSMKVVGRKRRQGVKDGGVSKRCGSRIRRCSPEKTDSDGSETVKGEDIKTLPLLPETSSVKEAAKQRFPLWLSFENGGEMAAAPAVGGLHGHKRSAVVERRVVAASWVRVECVTDTWVGDIYPYGGIGLTDEERVRSLDLDTCPGFISDGLDRVRWTNQSYRRMAAGERAAGQLAVSVVVEDGVALPMGCAAFTCRVRVVTCGNEKASKTVPCDVWRMDCGGFAWRLDMAAALSLCIGN